MKIAVIAAMGKELRLLLEFLGNYEEAVFGKTRFYFGKIGDHEVVMVQCGIGKVNAALTTMITKDFFHPELIINSGVAGGLDESMHIGDILIADRVAYHDVWCGPGTQYGQADGCPLYFTPYEKGLEILQQLKTDGNNLKFGLLCSGDQFISTPEQVKEIKNKFPDALGCDMESAAIAQTGYWNSIPFVVIRVMSDMPGGGENISQYKNFWSEAPAKTFQIVSSFIKKL